MYEFKLIPEAVRAAGFAAIVFGVLLLAEFDIDEVIVDWREYVKAAASGLAAAVGAAGLGVLTRRS